MKIAIQSILLYSWAVLQADIPWISWCGCFSIKRSLPATWLLLVCQWFQQIRVRKTSSAVELQGRKALMRIANIPWHMQTLLMFAQLPSSSSVPSVSSCEVHSFNAATNSVSERNASALRRIKTYLCSTMTQSSLNNVMVTHIHQDLTDSINYLQVLNEFSSANENKN